MSNKKALELRKKISKKRPKFKRHDSHKRKEVSESWRKPKGLQNKMRRGFWGIPAKVSTGYRGPAEVRGLHPSGLMPVLVHNVKEISQVDTKTQGVLFAKVGKRNKLAMLNECKEKKIAILNVKNIDEEIKAITEGVKARQEEKKKLADKKKKKVVPKQEKKVEEKKTPEQEKKEMDKILTKRE